MSLLFHKHNNNTYPYRKTYSVWPGSNSNTFTAFVARQISELKLDLPPADIGKDYINNGGLFSKTPSGTGYQIPLYVMAGLIDSEEEGFEFNGWA